MARFEPTSLPNCSRGCTLVDREVGRRPLFCWREFWAASGSVIVLELHPVARKIADLLEPHLQRQGYELISVEFKQGTRGALLRLLVDKPDGGISLDDLERLSPVLSDLLDVYDPIESRYLLEVASPGINRPLLKLEHFNASLGQKIKIRTRVARNGTKSFVGKLVEVSAAGIELEDLTTRHREAFGFEEIQTANYEHDFDEGKRRPATRQGARS